MAKVKMFGIFLLNLQLCTVELAVDLFQCNSVRSKLQVTLVS